ncbi:VC2046/SO_2500 family protein [Aestuariibacter sp. AA17]|uniref:VC2046/SO_2500 family protein n=1 Tax=Fluctibacter corallii TaxID=2984329 RepID=A0ABT3A999_9ALTE|nr:VC2046/SO_2500 family protein [Aestuariibacter sp. AA17]MCV2885255.1 VC2046/SO_2500 family protein [Aestuariibacter sp. AA17]
MPDSPITSHLPIINDVEYTGSLNRASTQGASFGLLLAMLQQNILERPHIEKAVQSANQNEGQFEHLKVYPTPALKADEKHFSDLHITSKLIHQNIQDAMLFQTMRPHPLSQYDDASHINDEIIANCDMYTQRRLRNAPDHQVDSEIQVDETKLYDVLESLSEMRF